MKKTMIDYIKRGVFDELYTPIEAIMPLIKYIPKDKVIWECTDFGSSNLTKALIENGYIVVSTHKNTDLDFLNDNPTFDYDFIITNPPYSLKDEFLERCYELGKPFALLLPITALEGIKRGKMYKKNGIELMVLDKRCDFTGKKSCWFNTSWFCHNILPQQLVFEELIKCNTQEH